MSELADAIEKHFRSGGGPVMIVKDGYPRDVVQVTARPGSDEITAKCGCGKGEGKLRPGGEWTCPNCGTGVIASPLSDSVVAVETPVDKRF